MICADLNFVSWLWSLTLFTLDCILKPLRGIRTHLDSLTLSVKRFRRVPLGWKVLARYIEKRSSHRIMTTGKNLESQSRQRTNHWKKKARMCQRIGRRPTLWKWCNKEMAIGSITRTKLTCRACSLSLRKSFGLWSKTTLGCSIRQRNRILLMTGNEDSVLRKTRLSKWEESVSESWILTMQMIAFSQINHWRQEDQLHRKSRLAQMQRQPAQREEVNWRWMHLLILMRSRW